MELIKNMHSLQKSAVNHEKDDLKKELQRSLWYCDRLADEIGLKLTHKIKEVKKGTKRLQPHSAKKATL